ncbi:MAG: ankyrin repeat domain-containing protein, partial [Fibrella sp.]|nr:ankyrin repeat domain-containing protein [Armatimonadota bacterium]
HSLALVFQLLVMVGAFGAYQTFALLRNAPVAGDPPTSYRFFYSPVAVVGILLFHWGIGAVLSQAIYGTVWSHDYFSLTTFRMLGGRIKPGMQNMDEMRKTFEQLIAHNKPFTADRFLEAGMNPDLIYSHEPTPRTLLAEAVLTRRPAIVRSLLTHGANPNPTFGESPLWLAARDGSPEIVKMLLQHGAKASFNYEQRAEITPEMLALLEKSGAVR